MRRILIDTDAGVDDALAILYALATPGVRIEAITVVHGNVPVDTAVRNVGEILRVSGRTEPVVVVRGAGAPLRGARVDATHVHGDDGLGGWTRHVGPAPVQAADGRAHEWIARIARQFPGEVTLVTIGPLTNAALALERDPAGFRSLANIVTMGGAVAVPGNITPVAEFNIYADPEAARAVVRAGVPFVLVGLDATTKAVFTRQDLDATLGGRTDTRAQFLRCICEQMFGFYRSRTGRDAFYLHDPLAVALAIDAGLGSMQSMPLDIETAGEITRGMVVADRRGWVQAEASPHSSVCVEVDCAAFLRLFRERVVSRESA